MGGDARARDDNKIDRLSGSGRYVPRARPEGDAPKKDVPALRVEKTSPD